MKHLFLIPVLLLCLGARADLPAGWGTNFNATLAEAKTRQQPALVYFTASWCAPCKLMARTTFTNEMVLAALGGVSRVALDIDEHADLARQRGVNAVPAFHLLSPAGDEVATTTGYQNAEQFVQWLTNSISEMKEVIARRERFEQALARADELLRATNAAALDQAVAELFNLCAERDGGIAQAAATRLAAVATRQPSALLGGLEHARLAVRIQVANLLRTRLGDEFAIDPWSDAATRRAAVATWRERLAAGMPPATGSR